MQMADVYRAAHLTIIAAAGNDPHYGLPGVSQSSRGVLFQALSGPIFFSALPALGGHTGITAVGESAWARRAWTFQEGIFSRRRLIFTQRRVIFACESSWGFEGSSELKPKKYVRDDTEDWLPTEERYDHLIRVRSCGRSLSQAMAFLEAYSRRTLSYQEDALNAISGALSTLRKNSVYHIWAVPFCHTGPHLGDSRIPLVDHKYNITLALLEEGRASRPYNDNLELLEDRETTVDHQHSFALLWSHEQPCHRRDGFPSWSPIGWEGEVT